MVNLDELKTRTYKKMFVTTARPLGTSRIKSRANYFELDTIRIDSR